jgi:glucose/arabinose dehydrogenase
LVHGLIDQFQLTFKGGNMIKPICFKLLFLFAFVALLPGQLFAQSADHKVNPEIWVRPGYKLTIAVDSPIRARHMCLGPDGTLYYGTTPDNVIMAAKDKNHDGYYETLTQFYKSEHAVTGLFWYDGWLWYAESGAIYKLKDKNNDGVADERETVIPPDSLPSGGGHHYRPVLIYKGQLYTALGDAGNATDMTNSDREKIWTYNLEGKDKQLWSSGIRNTEKLVVRPGTDEIWGMDNGSDWFGKEVGDAPGMQPITDYNPPEEMNKYIKGGFYGHPFLVGNRVPRYEFMKRPDLIELAAKTIVPEWCAPAHWAPLSMMFYTGNQFPSDVKGDAFVTFHGSWNSSVKVGYQVARVLFEDGHPYGQLPYVRFITDSQKVLGRPVDVIQAPDGSILISDDGNQTVDGYKENNIYRLSYVGNKK